MAKAAMPEVSVGGDGGEGARHRHRDGEGIEVARTTAPESHGPCPEILHRKTPRVKFNRIMIVRDEIFNNARSNKNITKRKATT
jgi:hypothetical protein